jgi:threonine aldolase
MPMGRRQFLLGSALPALADAVGAHAAVSAGDAVQDRTVQFRSDSLALSPADYARLLARLAENPGIQVDEYSRHGVVRLLEKRMAAILGKEMAIYLPTGTLANHLAVRLLAGNRRRVLVQQESHLYNDAGDCAQQLSGLALVPLASGQASFTLNEVSSEIQRAESGRVHTRFGVISIESPVRRAFGETFNFSEMQKIADFAREREIGLHLDGARLFLSSPYTGILPATYAAIFDTVYVSLYKCFNSTSGALLAGPRKLIKDLYHVRRMFGGGLHQVWPDAAVALHFLDGFAERYASAVSATEALFRVLGTHPNCRLEKKPQGTNVTLLKVKGANAASLPQRLWAKGIAIGPGQRSASETADFVLVTNESVLRRPTSEIIDAFVEALA